MGKRNFLLLFTFPVIMMSRFGNLSVHYPSLPVPIRSCLAEAVYLSRETGKSQACSNILLGLSHSQANWNDLEERACQGIVERMRITLTGFHNQVNGNLQCFLVLISPINVLHRRLPIPCGLSPYYPLTVTCRRRTRKRFG
jgi:hypothetical protein